MQYYLSLFPSITPSCLEAMSGKSHVQTTSTSRPPVTLSSVDSKIYNVFEQTTAQMSPANSQAAWNNLLECMTQSNGHYCYAISQSIGLYFTIVGAAETFSIIKNRNPMQNAFARRELGYAALKLIGGIAMTYFGITNLNANAHACCENKLAEMN